MSMPSVVTANRLTDGIVVYLAKDGGWTEELGRARIASTEDEIKNSRGRSRQGGQGAQGRRRLCHGRRAA